MKLESVLNSSNYTTSFRGVFFFVKKQSKLLSYGTRITLINSCEDDLKWSVNYCNKLGNSNSPANIHAEGELMN
jgi:hypothetical protein